VARSADPAAELPGLILALDEQHGSINRIMLGMADWDSSRPRRLRVDGPAGSRVVRQFAKRMGAITVEVPAGHVAMVSHPDDVAQLIKTAAETVQTAH
jgi:hypothetical protein